MIFKKWPSIENSYQQKFIDVFLAEFPDLAEEGFVITEKLHGSSLQVFFQPNESWIIGKRTAYLEDGEKFFGIWNVLPEYEPIFECVQAFVNNGELSLRLFGELFGPGIQKGVDYGKRKRILFFGFMIDDEMMPFLVFQEVAEQLGFAEHLVPIMAIVGGLKEALEFDTEFVSKVNPVEGNLCEGIVIQPYRKVYVNAGGKRFLLKKKNEGFLEKSKEKKPSSPGDPEVQRLNAEFQLYITENRLQGIFSKHGEIEEPQQIGDYIRLMLADAKEDFLKDHEEAFGKLNKVEQGKVTNVGGLIANILKGHL